MRVLIGGVGYRNLCDHSFGVVVVDTLAARDWPALVSVEDISYNPIALVQRLQDEPAERPFDMAIVVAAVDRLGRTPGVLSFYRWDRALPGDSDIQAAVADAVTGVIALDNTLIVTRHFAALPDNVIVIEVQPRIHEFGSVFSPEVASAFQRACSTIRHLAITPGANSTIPVAALGGGAVLAARPPTIQVQHVDRPR
jgi:hydrogenase maturation protease